jgi:catalase
MGGAPKEVKIRHIGSCLRADPAYGEGVAKALRISTSEIAKNG